MTPPRLYNTIIYTFIIPQWRNEASLFVEHKTRSKCVTEAHKHIPIVKITEIKAKLVVINFWLRQIDKQTLVWILPQSTPP